jgi:hypothetical protein
LIFASIDAEADFTGMDFFMYSSDFHIYFHRAKRNLQPFQVKGSGSIQFGKMETNPS